MDKKKSSSGTLISIDSLLPGDVLLIKGRGSTSTLIRHASAGNYSHAAFVIDKYQLFEADDYGVGTTYFEGFHFFEIEGVRRECLLLPYDMEYFACYRHPDLNHKPKGEVEEAIQRVIRERFADPYS